MPADRSAVVLPFHDWTSKPTRFRDEPNNTWRSLTAKPGKHVATMQRRLRTIGLNPNGPIDGIFGYRTQSAVRLFQEYVHTIDGDAGIGTADGIAGRNTHTRIQQWIDSGKIADWVPADNMQSEIFTGLQQLRDHYLSSPPDPATTALRNFNGATSTRQIEDWSFNPADTHLIGIRRDDTSLVLNNGKFVRRNDDIFVLLINGIRIVFRGSTDPSPKMAGREDAAFLIRGQHEYRFGWHKLSSIGSQTEKVYRAFKPKSNSGVLVVRAKNGQLTPSSFANGAHSNFSINIHWSGSGTSNWSAGCQVMAGKRYKNIKNEIIDLSASASPGYAGLALSGSASPPPRLILAGVRRRPGASSSEGPRRLSVTHLTTNGPRGRALAGFPWRPGYVAVEVAWSPAAGSPGWGPADTRIEAGSISCLPMATRILVVDDEPDLLELVRFHLSQAGFEVETAETGEEGIARARRNRPDLAVLDVMLPDLTGTEVCRRMRADPELAGLPILMLTAKSEEVDRIVGFELGVDDYVTKPFSPRELTLRVQAILRRARREPASASVMRQGGVELDPERHRCRVDGESISLTAKEFQLLVTLMGRPGRVFAREQLLDRVWGSDITVTLRTIDTHMKRLREKLGRSAERIETVRGVGYRFAD